MSNAVFGFARAHAHSFATGETLAETRGDLDLPLCGLERFVTFDSGIFTAGSRGTRHCHFLMEMGPLHQCINESCLQRSWCHRQVKNEHCGQSFCVPLAFRIKSHLGGATGNCGLGHKGKIFSQKVEVGMKQVKGRQVMGADAHILPSDSLRGFVSDCQAKQW